VDEGGETAGWDGQVQVQDGVRWMMRHAGETVEGTRGWPEPGQGQVQVRQGQGGARVAAMWQQVGQRTGEMV